MEKLAGFLSAVIWAILGAGVVAGFYYGELVWLWLLLGAAALAGVVSRPVLSLHPAAHRFVPA